MTADGLGEADQAAFGLLTARLDGAMAVVTTASTGEQAGCLVGFHSQCSLDPPLYSVWLSKANHTYRVGLFASHFAVHLLAVDDMELAELFGTLTGDEVDKFTRCEVDPGPGDVPLLRSCPDRLVGRRRALVDAGGDHACFIVEPVSAEVAEGRHPLRLSDLSDLEPGHSAEDRPRPYTQRSH